MELMQVGERTYYIKNPTNIGIYKIDEENVYLIDSGNDKDAGKKILKIVEEQGWEVKGIINTHSNADHIGGNKVIQDRAGCNIYAYNIEKTFTENPILESSFLYGGYPFKDLRNKFLLAKESAVTEIENNLPEGLEYFTLKGHFFFFIFIKTSDNVYFLADSLFSEETISKYHLFFIYDVKEYLNTLDYLSSLNASLFIPSHCEATNNIKSLIDTNRNKIQELFGGDKLTMLQMNSYGMIAEYRHHQKLLALQKSMREKGLSFEELDDKTLVELSDIEGAYVSCKDDAVGRKSIFDRIKDKIRGKSVEREEEYGRDNL